MKKFIIILGVLFVLTINIVEAQSIDTEKSKVSFEIGNMKVNTVEGSFYGMNGELSFDLSELENSVFNVCIDASTVNTGNEKRDDHLRNEDFFDVEKFPHICIVSKSISKKGTEFLLEGVLTMRGVSKEVKIPFSMENNSLQGSFTVNRFDYEIGEDTGKFMVSEDVEISISCVLKNELN